MFALDMKGLKLILTFIWLAGHYLVADLSKTSIGNTATATSIQLVNVTHTGYNVWIKKTQKIFGNPQSVQKLPTQKSKMVEFLTENLNFWGH